MRSARDDELSVHRELQNLRAETVTPLLAHCDEMTEEFRKISSPSSEPAPGAHGPVKDADLSRKFMSTPDAVPPAWGQKASAIAFRVPATPGDFDCLKVRSRFVVGLSAQRRRMNRH